MVKVSHGGPPPAETTCPECTRAVHQRAAEAVARSAFCRCMHRTMHWDCEEMSTSTLDMMINHSMYITRTTETTEEMHNDQGTNVEAGSLTCQSIHVVSAMSWHLFWPTTVQVRCWVRSQRGGLAGWGTAARHLVDDLTSYGAWCGLQGCWLEGPVQGGKGRLEGFFGCPPAPLAELGFQCTVSCVHLLDQGQCMAWVASNFGQHHNIWNFSPNECSGCFENGRAVHKLGMCQRMRKSAVSVVTGRVHCECSSGLKNLHAQIPLPFLHQGWRTASSWHSQPTRG